MCQGEQKRLAGLGHPKHLLPLDPDADDPETILDRSIRLVRTLARDGHDTEIVVVGPTALEPITTEHRVALLTLPDPGYCILDGIAATLQACPAGPSRSYVLLGDVVWSHDALSRLLFDGRPLVFAGTSDLSTSKGEIYGMAAFAAENGGELEQLLATAPCRFADARGVRRRMFPRQQTGHLRRLLWHAMERKQLKPNSPPTAWHPDLYLPIDDWTDDIDTPADFDRLPALAAEARADDAVAQLQHQVV